MNHTQAFPGRNPRLIATHGLTSPHQDLRPSQTRSGPCTVVCLTGSAPSPHAATMGRSTPDQNHTQARAVRNFLISTVGAPGWKSTNGDHGHTHYSAARFVYSCNIRRRHTRALKYKLASVCPGRLSITWPARRTGSAAPRRRRLLSIRRSRRRSDPRGTGCSRRSGRQPQSSAALRHESPPACNR